MGYLPQTGAGRSKVQPKLKVGDVHSHKVGRPGMLNILNDLPMIPPLQEIEIPDSIPNRLKKDIWRSLKTLKREYTEAHEEEEEIHPDDYARMGHWDQKRKQDRRRMQNRKAARRFRVKNLEVIWALVTSFQDLKKQNDMLRADNHRLRAHQVGVGSGRALVSNSPTPEATLPPLQDNGKLKMLAHVASNPRPSSPKVADKQTVAPAKIEPANSATTSMIKIPPPLPPQGTKKRKLTFGDAQILPASSNTSWIVQKNALDPEQERLLTLTIVCGMQALSTSTDQAMLTRLRVQSQTAPFLMTEGDLPGATNGNVRLPRAWLTALQTIANIGSD